MENSFSIWLVYQPSAQISSNPALPRACKEKRPIKCLMLIHISVLKFLKRFLYYKCIIVKDQQRNLN